LAKRVDVIVEPGIHLPGKAEPASRTPLLPPWPTEILTTATKALLVLQDGDTRSAPTRQAVGYLRVRSTVGEVPVAGSFSVGLFPNGA
jgi:hypothetical protein